ncbi:MAG: hypothetical protein HYT07_01735 [Candidatus Levybacteria bacterium]|nr:hypothetical protein [Candidatus Levybacteria bacterium]
MLDFFHHLFVPRDLNNHRAKILHNSNLLLAIVFLILTSFFVQKVSQAFPSILGVSTDITIDALFLLTNTKRQENGIHSLSLNAQLSEAASKKADDMFQYGYWAHNSPEGKTPWVFIKGAGYNYVYAGENLARGFTSTEDVINAWMESPTHKANMLSSNYQDVGFAVKIGQLDGEETVLIVEEFGNQNIPIIAAKPVLEPKSVERELSSIQTEAIMEKPLVQNTPSFNKPLLDKASVSSNVNKVALSIFVFSLFIDMIVVERKKIVRFVGHNLDHIFYLLLVFLLIGALSKGVVI